MAGSDPQLLVLTVVGVCTFVCLLASLLTWNLSRAKKVRLLEDQVIQTVRTYKERADQVELKLSEWQVTLTGILAEVEEFFDRSVKERKRSQLAANRVEQATANPAGLPLESLNRADQLAAVRGIFTGQ